MSSWGRAQDALHDLLWGMEVSMAGDRWPGLMEKLGVTWAEAKERCPELEESILETLASVVGFGTPYPSATDESRTGIPNTNA